MTITATRLLRTYRSSQNSGGTARPAESRVGQETSKLSTHAPGTAGTVAEIVRTDVEATKEAGCSYRPSLAGKRFQEATEDRVTLSRLYAALDEPSQAASLVCRDVACLRVRGQSGGLRLFEHRKRPTVFAKIVGRIVGIEEKERRITWLVDDGSAVVAVHHGLFRDQPVQHDATETSAITQRQREKRKAEECGIPSEYLRSVEPLVPPRSRVKSLPVEITEEARRRAMRMLRHFDVGSVVVVVGRVDTWFAGDGERFLIADRAVPRGRSWKDRGVRTPLEGYISLAADVDEEARHLIEAIQLAQEEYSRPFPMPASPKIPTRTDTRNRSSSERNAMPPPPLFTRHCVRPLRTYGSTRSETIRTLHSREVAEVAIQTISREKRPKEPPRSTSTDGREMKRRQLRDFRKLPDASMNEDTLRVYIEKHIRDHCSTSSDLGKDSGPPAFTCAYLASIPQLSAFAERVVCVALRNRMARRSRRTASKRASPARTVPTKEAITSKSEALLGSIMRTLLSEGTIVLADRNVKVLPAFDGQPNARESLHDESSQKTLAKDSTGDFKTARTALFEDLDTSAALDPDTSHFWRRRAAMQALGAGQTSTKNETYQLVTPSLLVKPLRQILKDDPGDHLPAPPVEHLVSRLKSIDERWRYITIDGIEGALALL